ncbi:MAG TPA: glucose-1-phosphate adenylyltransferase family protein [Ardenticatenaceae bacterium]|nr:glucose-1-phosphate adenylyltransferase family protein [Ardenticatenaceae bacterium]
MTSHRTLALILAGGKGSRLGVLTEQRSKPAMPFAGVFRLIDIPLSNILHSGLSDVWIIEQYEPHSLNEHLASGRPWDLDRTRGGLRLMPPYEGGTEEGFAQGNADAIYQHRHFIREFDPELIVVLSADHLYKLDYSRVIAQHHERDAKLTVVTTRVAREEASRFAVVEVGDDGRVTRFDYKPEKPRTDLVTAEIFVYDGELLLDTLEQLAEGGDSGEALRDYGHSLLPRLVEQGRVYEYRHEGYWRDAGTLESYWQVHMELLAAEPELALDDPHWPILTRDPQRLPARIHASARIDNSLISPGCVIQGQVEHSVLSPGVVIEEGAVVRDSVLLHDVRVRAGARVHKGILDERVVVGRDARVGGLDPSDDAGELTLIGMNVEIPSGEHVKAGAQLEPPAKRQGARKKT